MWKGSIRPSRLEGVFRSIFAALLVASAPIAGHAEVSVTTYHYDSLRTGWNGSETVLAASAFPRKFGVLATVQLDDQVDAQPLVVPGVTIAGAIHTVVYVATESNSVYGIDASSGQILVQTNLGPPVPLPLDCNANGPNVGITGTPVIDVKARTLFVVAYIDLTPSNPTPTPAYQLHALNLFALHDKRPPAAIAASQTMVDGSTYSFNATYQRQRPALLELNGVVYAGFGSFCDDYGQYSRGWVMGWNAKSLAPLPASQLNDTQTTDPNVDPPFFLTSVWMSGFGLASDGTSLYFSTFLDRKFRLQLHGPRRSLPAEHDVGWRHSHPGERGSAFERPCAWRRFHAVCVAKYVSTGSRGRRSWVRRSHAFRNRQRDLSLSRGRSRQRRKSVPARSGQPGDRTAA
jgi:hypothetical protein